MQTLGPLKLKKTGLEVRPAVFSRTDRKILFLLQVSRCLIQHLFKVTGDRSVLGRVIAWIQQEEYLIH